MSTANNQTGRLSPQSLLQQRYLIVEQAGRGGMGAVYQALDTRIGQRRVAIKEMSQANLDTSQLGNAITRFQQEANMLGSLSHPNLPRIHDAFSEQGRSFLVMDFIEGKTLFQLLKEFEGQPLPIVQVLLYARQLCDVLAYLHQHNPPIIFRDVKPTNVMVTASGQVFLIDFGIARIFKEGQQQDTVLLGSPGYAPPEQHGLAQTTPRSDIYGLGATLHYCLTGRDPYYANDRFSFPPIRQYNPHVPTELDELIQHMVAQNDWERPVSTLEVQQVLLKISQQAADHTSTLNPALVAAQYIPPTQMSGHLPPPQAPTVAVNMPAPPIVPVQRTTPAPFLQQNALPVSSVWSRGFIILFTLLLVVTAGGSISIFNNVPSSDHTVELALSLVLLLMAFIGGGLVKTLTARVTAFATGLAVIVAAIAFATQSAHDLLPVVGLSPQALDPILQSLTNGIATIDSANLLLTVGLAGAAIISLVWLSRPFRWIERLILSALFGSAAVCMFVQYSLPDSSDPAAVTKHILLLITLILLIQGVLLAVHTDDVQEGS